MQALEEYFQEFSDQVREVIRLHLVREPDLSQILKQLGLPPEDVVEVQAMAIRTFILTYGPIYFLTAIKAGISGKRIQSMTIHLRDGTKEDARKEEATVFQSEPEMRQSSHRPISPRSQRAPLVTPSHAIPLRSPHSLGKVPLIDLPGYKGLERRSGTERRHSQRNRRSDVELVYMNKRFGGGERRKMIRRESDRLVSKKEENK